MKTKTLITLYIIVTALVVGVFIAKAIQTAEEDSSAKFSRGYKPFADLSPGEVAEVEFKGANHTTTVKVADGKWAVVERDNYPVNLSALQSFIRTLKGLTISQFLEAGTSFDPRFGMDESSAKEEMHGTVVTLKKSDGAEITSFKVGKDITDGGKQDPMAMMMGGGSNVKGKYIRLSEDLESVYVINDSLSEVKPHPKEWLLKDFLKVENITAISLSPEGNLGQLEWQVSRPNAAADFTIEGGSPAGKEVNATTVNALKSVLGFAAYEDIVSAEAAKGLRNNSKSRRALIKTADGFTYTLDISPKGAEGTENFLMEVKVSANLKTEREKPEGESEEAAKAAEATFQETLKTLQDKLTFEQSLAGRVFEVTNYTVQALLKGKADLIQDKAAAPGGQAPPQGQFPGLSPGSVTTPPFQIPNQ